MEEDEIDDNPLFKRKRKDKTMKCTKCGRGGHPEATCLSRPENTQWCHVCQQAVNEKHDTLECPLQDIVCEKCGMIGHLKPLCFCNEQQKDMIKLEAWNLRDKLDVQTMYDGSWNSQTQIQDWTQS